MHRLHRSRIAAACGAVVLAIAAAAYWYTVEPAPAVKVRWRAGLEDDRRAAAERRLLLQDPIVSEGRTVTYNVLDTSSRNLAAIVTAPEIEDTSEIDRERYTLRADVPYGTGWTWVGRRLPLLRMAGVLEGVVALCCLAIGWEGVEWWRRSRAARSTLRMPDLS